MASTSSSAAAVTASSASQSQPSAQATAALDNMSQSLQQQQDQHLRRPNLPDRFTDIEEDTMRWPSGTLPNLHSQNQCALANLG